MAPSRLHSGREIRPTLITESRLQRLLVKGLIADTDRFRSIRHLKAVALALAITLLGAAVELHAGPTNLAMLYLLGVVVVSYRWGLGPSLTYSLVSTITLDFFFVPPYESFAIADLWYSLTAITFMGVALFVSVLTATVRRHAVAADQREAHTAALYALMQSLAATHGPAEVLSAAADRIRTTFGLEIAVLLASEAGRLVVRLEPAESIVDAAIQTAAEKVFTAAKDGARHREGAFLPLGVGNDVIGVIALMKTQSHRPLGNAEELVLEAMAGQVALALKRAILEERAREAERARERAQRAKAEAIATLAGGLAHDLNNLLTGVLGNACLIAESMPDDHPCRNMLRDLTASGEQAAHVVAQMLSYAGKGRFFNESVDLSAIVEDFVRRLSSTPPNIELCIKTEDRLPLLEGDRNQLLQLIGNLYLNAVEAIGEAPGRIAISTYRRNNAGNAPGDPAPPSGECLCLSVADTGCGIEEAVRPRIFDPFFTTKFVGRGLGLPAAEGIMRAHNGTIQVASVPGKGSTFTCLFAVPAKERT